jgi:hypothetical protein
MSDDKTNKRKPLIAVMRPLDPSDPRSWDHLSHDKLWREFARLIGQSMAQRDWERENPESKQSTADPL